MPEWKHTSGMFGDKLVDWEALLAAGGDSIVRNLDVVELGPGGLEAQLLAPLARKYWLIDSSKDVLDHVAASAPDAIPVQAVFDTLPFGDGEVDVVLDFSSTDNAGTTLADKHEAWGQAARVLRPGGLLVTSFASAGCPPLFPMQEGFARNLVESVADAKVALERLDMHPIAASAEGTRSWIVARRRGKIAIHGLGYVGLTAALHWAQAGYSVLGYDPSDETAQGIARGRPRAGEFLAYLNADVAEQVSCGRLAATQTFTDVLGCRVQVLAVPSERADEPYMDIVRDTVQKLHEALPAGALIIIESTLTPGTVDRMLPDLPRVRSGELDLAVAPRRDWFADRTKNLETLTRVVGGTTPTSTARAHAVLRAVSRNILSTSYRTAEVVKALENAMLHVPVMLATELAMTLPEVDVREALRLACTHWRLMDIYLGFGTGGRCVPLGTKYLRTRCLQSSATDAPSVLQAALDTDVAVRRAVANAVTARGLSSAVVLGASYRPDFRDAGMSPGLAVARHLSEQGIAVTVYDPLWTDAELRSFGVTPAPAEPALWKADVLLIATPHSCFRELPQQDDFPSVKLVIDAQGCWQRDRQLLRARGVTYLCMGETGWAG